MAYQRIAGSALRAVDPQRSRVNAQSELSETTRAAALLSGIGLVTGLGGLLFNVLVARGGGAESYGAVGVLLSLGTIAGFLATGNQFAVARSVATSTLSTRRALRHAVVASVPWLAVAVVGAVLCVPIAQFLHLSSVVPVLLAGLLFAVVILAAIPAGLLIGQRRFTAIAWLGIVAVAVRLGGGMVVGRTGDTVSAALIASLIPIVLVSVATLVVSLRGSTTVHATSANAPSSAGLAVDAAAGALLSAGLWGIWSLPLLAVRHDLPAGDAGIFAALQLVVSGSLFLTGPIVTVFHPTIARTRQPRTILAGGVATLAVAAAASLALIAIGPWVISAVYGRGYQGDRQVLAALCLSASCVALATYVLWVSRALQRSTRPVGVGVCLAVLIEAAFMAVSHGSIIALALSPAVSIAGGAALVLVGTRWRALATADRRARSSADRTSTRDRSPLLREGPG